MKKNDLSPEAFRFEGKMSLKQALPLGMQHVLAMFVGNLTPLLIITGACGLAGGEFADLRVTLLQNAMLVAGIVTLVQLYSIGPIGGKVPIIMGTSSGFIGVFSSVAASIGGGVLAYGAIMGASLIGGLFETVLGFFSEAAAQAAALCRYRHGGAFHRFEPDLGRCKLLRRRQHPRRISARSKTCCSPSLVLVVILICKHSGSTFLNSSSILVGIICGYIAAFLMGLILPTTALNAEGVAYTKAWVLNWNKVAEAKWFALPQLMPVKPVFDMRAIAPVMIMFIVTAVETVGDISGVIMGGMDREATDTELSGGVICDGIGSSFAALFGVLPNTSFSQNVGLVTMTKVVNRFALATGAIFLILCGLVPKLGALVSIMPQSVLGGAAVMMFSSIVVSGIQLITREPLTPRSLSIVSVALGLGYGIGANNGILAHAPQMLSLVFGGSGIVPAALVAILLNLAIPKDENG